MKFIVLFEDNADAAPDIRTAHIAAHLAFLEAQAGAVISAGPLADRNGAGRGGLWLVEAETADAVERLVRDDPFWPTGLRKSHRVLVWRQVFDAGRRLPDPG